MSGLRFTSYRPRGAAALLPGFVDADRARRMAAEAEGLRRRCIDALQADEMRGWLDAQDMSDAYETLNGLCALLVMAGMLVTTATGTTETADLRVIRGAIGAINDAVHRGYTLTMQDMAAISSAAQRAHAIFERSPAAVFARAFRARPDVVEVAL